MTLQIATLSLLLGLGASAAPQPKTVWLVQPLYPGQELLVGRSEEALGKMLAGEKDQLVGARALTAALQGKRPSLACLTGEKACADPVDDFVASLGLGRIVLLKGGHEDVVYRFRIASYVPETGELTTAEGTGKSLEQALLAATIKVVPLASTVKVTSTPAGATLFIDGEKLGVTPYAGQILPGERTLKLELASHLTIERKVEVPVRGALELAERLEKVPARLVINARPEGAAISVDGKRLGADKVDQPIEPGRHRVLIDLEGFVPHAEEVEIQPGDTLTLEKSLKPTGWTSFKRALSEAQEDVYSRGSYFQVNYEQVWMWGDALYAKENPFKDQGPVGHRLTGDASLSGFSFEYGQDGRYFGLMVVGAGYYHSTTPFAFTLEREAHDTARAGATAIVLRALQPHLRLAFWRFSLIGQVGIEARTLILDPEVPEDGREIDSLFVVDVQGTAQIGLRAQVFAGAYVEGVFRHSWTLSDTAAFQGFHLGVGYAF